MTLAEALVYQREQDEAKRPFYGNPNLAAQGRRYNLAERQQTSPLMQAGNVQFEKEKSSLSDRGAVTDLINKGFIAGLGGAPVDLINMGLTPLGIGSAFPFGGSEHIKRAMEDYGVATPTERPIMEGIASLTPPRAVMGVARVAGQGAEAVGRAAAPVAGQALENYMGRTGMQLSVAPKAIKDSMPTEYKSAMSIEPPHNVRDTKKLLSLTESMKNTGWQGRPILTYDVGRGEEALTGSHRIKAAREANIEVPIYRIENAGDYVDKNGKSILDVGFMELDDQVKWLNKFGDKNAAKLLKQEPEL